MNVIIYRLCCVSNKVEKVWLFMSFNKQTTKNEFYECCVCLQSLTYWWCSCVFNTVFCLFFQEQLWDISWTFFCFFLCLPAIRSSVSVVLTFNASPTDIAPPSQILLSEKENPSNGFVVNVLCLCFFVCLRSKISSVSVVFVFNALPNAIAPSVSISQTVNKKENHWSGFYGYVLLMSSQIK